MWSRRELKAKAKAAMSVNYWRMVLASLILALITGSTGTITFKLNAQNKNINVSEIFSSDKSYEDRLRSIKEQEDRAAAEYYDSVDELLGDDFMDDMGAGAVIAIVLIVLIFVLIIVVIASSINIFLVNPLIVGGAGFFLSNADGEGEISQFGVAFKKNYLQIVLGMLLRGLYTFLWTLLFIVPGIIKTYEYRMVPYILADNPTIKQRDAFYLSREMMRGNKWKAFVLDLSFIGWGILNLMTVGILGIFFVGPYRNQTNANLYLALRGESTAVEETPVYDNYVEMN